ncbi:exosporium leader peptide-containing protein [Bacillus toyonensis]|nr:exosporium leader peptide-containing protein [Bacillus toyonensis]MDF9450985.1 exosporium leader peptide-containing protein [Bacillus toyonensis]MDG1562870.1 exosporium leader peptide-containing protein [Bacillus toyonensis]
MDESLSSTALNPGSIGPTLPPTHWAVTLHAP